MKFYSVSTREQIEDEAEMLAEEYRQARAIGVVRAGAAHLFFRARTKVYAVPFTEIRHCYRRVMLVPAGSGRLHQLYPEGASPSSKASLPFTPAACAALQADIAVRYLCGRTADTDRDRIKTKTSNKLRNFMRIPPFFNVTIYYTQKLPASPSKK